MRRTNQRRDDTTMHGGDLVDFGEIPPAVNEIRQEGVALHRHDRPAADLMHPSLVSRSTLCAVLALLCACSPGPGDGASEPQARWVQALNERFARRA